MKKKLQNVLESYNSIYSSGSPLSEAVRPNGTIDAISYEETAVDDMSDTLLELFLREYDMKSIPGYPNHHMPGIRTFSGYAVPVFRISMTTADGTDGSELFDKIRDTGEEDAKYIDRTFVVDPDFDRKFKDALKRELYGKVGFGRTWSKENPVRIKDDAKIHFSFTVTPQDVSSLDEWDELTVDVDIEFRPAGEEDDMRIEFGRIPGPVTIRKNAELFARNQPTPNLPESVQPRRLGRNLQESTQGRTINLTRGEMEELRRSVERELSRLDDVDEVALRAMGHLERIAATGVTAESPEDVSIRWTTSDSEDEFAPGDGSEMTVLDFVRDVSNGMVVESADELDDYFIIDTLHDGHSPLTFHGVNEPIKLDTEEQAYWAARELVRNLKYADGVQIVRVKNGRWNPIVEISSPE